VNAKWDGYEDKSSEELAAYKRGYQAGANNTEFCRWNIGDTGCYRYVGTKLCFLDHNQTWVVMVLARNDFECAKIIAEIDVTEQVEQFKRTGDRPFIHLKAHKEEIS